MTRLRTGSHWWHASTRGDTGSIQRLALSAIFALLGWTPVLASEFLPLERGRIWHFEDNTEIRVVASSYEAGAMRSTTEESTPDGGLARFEWEIARDGSVRLLAWEDTTQRVDCDPPLIWMIADPHKGDEWKNRSVLRNETGKPIGVIENVLRVAGEEQLELGWGGVVALRVELSGSRPPMLAGGSSKSDSPIPRPWVTYYARRIGWVRCGTDMGRWVDVTSLAVDFVNVDTMRWGACKSYYYRRTDVVQ